ncbi:MAG: type II secretion system F family protein [Propionicimonas sp.]|nr:type II secretion system F family protein [Propionicimonas sp.]
MVPASVDVVDGLDRLLTPTRPREAAETPTTSTERIGHWTLRHLPPALWKMAPLRDLEILRKSVSEFYGEKALVALIGLVTVPALTWVLSFAGLRLPIAIPVGATLAISAGLWFLPDIDVRHRAAEAKFGRALGAYIELVAMERQSGSGARQALEIAATVGDSWVFTRISQELARSGWAGQTPWEALHNLGEQLGLPALGDLSDIMRLGGEEGAQVVTTLRARAGAIRTQMRTDAVAHANNTAERLTLPGMVMAALFTVILLAPGLAAMFVG